MKISFVRPAAVRGGAEVVFAVQGPTLCPGALDLDKRLKGQIGRALKAGRYKGEVGELLEILAPAGATGPSRIIVAGLGTAGKAGNGEFERIGGALAARLQTSGESLLTVRGEGVGPIAITQSDAMVRLAHGVLLRSYRFDRYRTRETAAKKPSLARLVCQIANPRAADTAFKRFAHVADGVCFARDLVSEPANVLTPREFAGRCAKLASLGLSVEVLGPREMRRAGFGALLGVAQGSVNEPRLVVMQWRGGGRKATPPVLLVGKGVTFDSGGISIKPAAGMEQMKWDMGGAAAVAGTMRALALRKARAHVVGILGLVENMPSGTAQRPGDVVTSLSGQTIEVINTDAEGRLVLCDAMHYGQQRFKPKVMVDLATLTGAMIISLGHEYAGLFSNSDDLAKQLVSAGFATGDKLWRFPMGDAYDRLIASPIADMKNVGPRDGGSITAAQFLKRFVKDGVNWAHLDIAGMVWADKDGAMWEKGATGYGVRLLDRYIADYHESA